MTGRRRLAERGQETLHAILVVALVLLPVLVSILTLGSMVRTDLGARAAAAGWSGPAVDDFLRACAGSPRGDLRDAAAGRR